jgi:hypothetical protein
MLQKKHTDVDPHYFNVWEPTHQGNADPRVRGTRPEVGHLRPRYCICYGRRYPTWKVSEYINYCIMLSIVSLYCKLALGDGVVDCGTYAQQRRSSNNSLSSRSDQSRDDQTDETL